MKIINVLQNAKNSLFFKVHFKMRVLAFLMVFFVLISPFYGIKKVKANPIAIGGSAIIGLILSGLAAQGLISGEYKVTAAQLTQINDLAQAQLALEGATAVAAAQKLGDALEAGVESAKIKALASGAVIYAFLQAIIETLQMDSTADTSIVGTDLKLLGYFPGGYIKYSSSGMKSAPLWPIYQMIDYGNDLVSGFSVGLRSLHSTANEDVSCRLFFYANDNSNYLEKSAYLQFTSSYWYYSNRNQYIGIPYTNVDIKALPILQGGIVYTDSVSRDTAESITIPTLLPTDIKTGITNWDGISDLVLAPPLPYDIPEDQDFVVDPTYGGEVIDPTDPVDPPAEEEGISLPWLSALLALLGLGKLTGIDEGVLSGIDSIVDGISSTIQDVIDGVKTTAGEWATAATAAITSAISGIQSGISSIADTISHAFDPPSKDIDWDKLKSSGSVIFTKFPFSIPADLKFLVGLLVSDPQAPKWTVTVPFSIVGDWAQDGEFVLDFSVIDGFMVIVRNIELLAFIFGMVFMTRQLIWK